MAITRKLQKTTEATSFPGAIPMQYKYTMGVAGEKFFTALKNQGKLLASTCPDCGFTYLPARTFCERCFGRSKNFHDAGLKGTLMAFTTSYEDYKGNETDEPAYFGLVKIHGTDTTLVHRLGGKKLSQLCVEDEVKAVLAPKAKRAGQITDILYFEKA